MTVPSINDVRKKWSIFRLLPQVHNHLNLGYFSPHCAKRTYEFQYKINPISSTFFTSFNLLDTRTSGGVLWIWLRPFIHPSATQDFRIGLSFFFCFLALKWEKWALSLLSRPVGKAQNVPQNLIHDRDLINLYIISLLEYEITNSLQRFCKNHISRKNLVLDLWSQNL